ncbi:DUF1552 domain-containing protein [Luteolibacter sp. SL250]|uniref:DUF1552 domain-containing protein n=1 Tax=Luteolibacter sp. SL250 TaxID=2995170 RepID=UPI0022713851|nr:DUF1552 domain-containing protein [Luteolibacter sp. SL250]WAC20540.1 DUF1552 domain-containing protein [Luteolibacter sp. SL250]
MNIQRQNWLISRRHFLRGAGACIALPLLQCMVPARAATPPGPQPRRGVFIYLPNGVNTYEYQILEAGVEYKLSKPMASLEKHRSVITPISGLHHPSGLGHHHNCQRIWLNAAKVGQTHRATISVDQLIAQQTAPYTRFPSLEISNQGGSMACSADGVMLPSHASPEAAFKELFEEPKGGTTAQRRDFNRRASVLDAVMDEAKKLESELGKEDKGRLDQYLTSVREVEIRTQRSDEWLDIPRPKLEPAMQSHLNRDISLQMLGDYLRTMYDLIALSFQTDITRVVTFVTGDEGKGPAIPEIGVRQDRHSLSHHSGNADRKRELAESDAFNISQFSYFLDKLKATPDGEGNLLDTTMALYGSGMSYGHSHGNANLPIIVAGGTKLGVRHGQHLDFNRTKDFKGYDGHGPVYFKPVNEEARLSNLLLTMAQKLGVGTDSFADSLKPISELNA